METFLRATAVYLMALMLVRLTGRRTVGEMTPFDLILLLLISESCSQALTGDDFSFTTAALVCLTLVGWELLLTLVKNRSRRAEEILEGVPTVVVRDGKPLHDVLKKCQIDEVDVLRAARSERGLYELSQVDYAILEADGSISILQKKDRP